MSNPVRILGIACTLRRDSYTRATLRAATELAPEGAEIEIFELDGIPGFNQDDEQNPPAKVTELKRRIREADAVLIVTPEYNYSIPGVLKNTIDWASRPYGDSAWNGKPAAVMGGGGLQRTVQRGLRLDAVLRVSPAQPGRPARQQLQGLRLLAGETRLVHPAGRGRAPRTGGARARESR